MSDAPKFGPQPGDDPAAYWKAAYEAAEEYVGNMRLRHEALVKERDEACRYLESWLVSFCSQHFPENTNWRPLTGDLIGMLTQADNASVIARDLRKERDTLAADKAELLVALKRADQFITNGIELGYIRMPDAGTPDPAHETPSIIQAALARHAAPAKGEV